MAEAYDNGLGVAQDKTEAAKWYSKAADQGDKHAQLMLALIYYYPGTGVPMDKKEAAKWFTKAAEQGDAEAQYQLGKMLRDGDGVVKDAQEAVKWFVAAAQSYANEQWGPHLAPFAQYDAGAAYEELGNKQEAFKWYLKSAYNGNQFAQERVGFALPLDSAENRIEAHKWLNLAAAQGREYAAALRDLIAKKMTPQELAEATRRARTFVAGEPLTTNSLPVALPAQASVKAVNAPERPKFEVLSVTARATEKNDTWWRFGYRLTVRNNGNSSEWQLFEIQFLDKDGYVIKTTTTGRTVIKPGTTETITGDTLINVPGAERVAKSKAIWKE